MTSLRGPGERHYNALSHQPTRAPIQFNSICSPQLWFMGYGIKISFPGPRSDVADHLGVVAVHTVLDSFSLDALKNYPVKCAHSLRLPPHVNGVSGAKNAGFGKRVPKWKFLKTPGYSFSCVRTKTEVYLNTMMS